MRTEETAKDDEGYVVRKYESAVERRIVHCSVSEI
jgi:hypothetical protein